MTVKRARRYIIVFSVGLVFAGCLGMRLSPARGVKRQLQEIRAAGLPTSAIELDAWYKSVPAKENRALLLLEVTRDYVSPAQALEKMKGDEPEYENLVAEHIAKNKIALEKLHRLPQLPGSRFPIDLSAGFSTLLPHLSPIKSLASLLKRDAEYQARSGNPDAAVRSLESGFAIAGAVRQEPIYVSEMVAIACSAITANAVEKVLNETQLSTSQLSTLLSVLGGEEAEVVESGYRGLVGERAIGISAAESNYQQFQAFAGGGPGANGKDEWLKVLAFQAYAGTGLRQRDLELYLEMMNLYIESRRAGFPEGIRKSDEAVEHMQERISTGFGRLAIFTRMLVPALENGTRKEANLAAKLRCAEIAVGLEQFRLDHGGTLPAILDELSPKYLHKVPVDPFDGKPMLYEMLPSKGYRVMSAGASGDRKRTMKNAEDVAIVVAR